MNIGMYQNNSKVGPSASPPKWVGQAGQGPRSALRQELRDRDRPFGFPAKVGGASWSGTGGQISIANATDS